MYNNRTVFIRLPGIARINGRGQFELVIQPNRDSARVLSQQGTVFFQLTRFYGKAQ
jgi:hypothetical protein